MASSILFLNSTQVNVPYFTTEIIILMISVSGNTLVLTAFYQVKKLRRSSNYFIASLSVADLLMSMVNQPIYLLMSVGFPHSLDGCLATIATGRFVCVAAVFSYLLITIDRWWAIAWPYSYQRKMKSSKLAIGMVTVCWTVSAILALPLLIGVLGLHNQKGWEISGGHCFMRQIVGEFHLMSNAVIITTTSTAIFCIYLYIYKIVKFHQQKWLMGSPKPSQGIIQDNKSLQLNANIITCHITRIKFRADAVLAMRLGIIVLVFLICQVPLATTYITLVTCSSTTCQIPEALFPCLFILAHFHAAINPFLYASQLPEFRYAMKNVLSNCLALFHIDM